ncbi:MAG: hypothetical protein ACKO5A_06915 [Actinomycetota bacterium]
MIRPRNGRVSRLGAALTVVVIAVVAVVGATTAGAHGGPVQLEVLDVETGPGTVRIEVRLSYTGDGHGVADAAVTVAGEVAGEPGGAPLTPVSLEPSGDEGVYAGDIAVPVPGTWSLRVTSAQPTASVALDVEVPVPATTAPATTTPVAQSPVSATSTGETSSSPWWWVAGGAAAAVAVGLGIVFVRQASRPGSIE